jgi:hypothetical protein
VLPSESILPERIRRLPSGVTPRRCTGKSPGLLAWFGALLHISYKEVAEIHVSGNIHFVLKFSLLITLALRRLRC